MIAAIGRTTTAKGEERTMATGRSATRAAVGPALAALAAMLGLALLQAAPAGGAFGDNYGITDINDGAGPAQEVPAYPGDEAFWAGACDIVGAPGFGEPIPGGVGSRPATIPVPKPGAGFDPPTIGEAAAPSSPPHCIDRGFPNLQCTNGFSGCVPVGPATPESWQPGYEPAWRLASSTQAGSHPDGTATFAIERNGVSRTLIGPDGTPDNIRVDLPLGFVGDPNAVPKCSAERFAIVPHRCPPASQIGISSFVFRTDFFTGNHATYPVYNLEPRKGYTAEFGIPDVLGFVSVRIVAEARTSSDFGITALVTQIPAPLPLLSQAVTLWGVPWAAEHDVWRVGRELPADDNETDIPETGVPADEQGHYDPSWGEIKPFFSNITGPAKAGEACDGTGSEPNTRAMIDTFQHPGAVDADGLPDLSDSDWVVADAPAPPLTGCEKVPFNPSISVDATSSEADSPTGLDFELSIPQNNEAPFGPPPPGASDAEVDAYVGAATDHWRSDAGLATAHLKDTVVTLPEGMSVNPSGANGQEACSPQQIGLKGTSFPMPTPIRFNNRPVRCPDASKIGTLRIETPLLEEEDWPTGDVYLAEQGDKPGHGANPFDSLLAIYLVAESEERDMRIKLAGEVDPDPEKGRLVTTFLNNPQLPFDKFDLHFKGGAHAPLANPPTCGTKTASAALTPWSGSGDAVEVTDTFSITAAPNGLPCPATLADRPFEPGLTAGLVNPAAGSSSPFVLRLTRPDGHQELRSMKVETPEGIAAVLRGVPRCGAADTRTGTCPEVSKIGRAITGAGAGQSPFFVRSGEVFLSGPYDPDGRGGEPRAPLSLAISVPAVAGPFDLGVVNVRAAIYVDPRTAELTVVSDPLPRILEGIPLRVRDVRVAVDRPGFMVAPTSCEEKRIGVTADSYQGRSAELSERLQLGGCDALEFAPELSFEVAGGPDQAQANDHPELVATLRQEPGEANIERVRVTLPQGMFLDQDSLETICTRPQYAAEECPEGSLVGSAIAHSPLLDEPLRGPVYLKASDNLLPDLAADLEGIVDIDLFGIVDQKNTRIRNDFNVVPDVPVSEFTLRIDGGPGGLLVNSTDLCSKRRLRRAALEIWGANGAVAHGRTLISACAKPPRCLRLERKADRATERYRKARRKARRADGKRARRLDRRADRKQRKARQAKRKERRCGDSPEQRAKRLHRRADRLERKARRADRRGNEAKANRLGRKARRLERRARELEQAP